MEVGCEVKHGGVANAVFVEIGASINFKCQKAVMKASSHWKNSIHRSSQYVQVNLADHRPLFFGRITVRFILLLPNTDAVVFSDRSLKFHDLFVIDSCHDGRAIGFILEPGDVGYLRLCYDRLQIQPWQRYDLREGNRGLLLLISLRSVYRKIGLVFPNG